MAHYVNGGAYTGTCFGSFSSCSRVLLYTVTRDLLCFFPVGATQHISTRLSSMCRSFGGEALIDATVRSIIIENGRAVGVRVSNTDELEEASDLDKVAMVEVRAKNVICATSIFNLYNKLLPQDLPAVKKFHDPSKRTIRQSNGHVFLFVKIRGKL